MNHATAPISAPISAPAGAPAGAHSCNLIASGAITAHRRRRPRWQHALRHAARWAWHLVSAACTLAVAAHGLLHWLGKGGAA